MKLSLRKLSGFILIFFLCSVTSYSLFAEEETVVAKEETEAFKCPCGPNCPEGCLCGCKKETSQVEEAMEDSAIASCRKCKSKNHR